MKSQSTKGNTLILVALIVALSVAVGILLVLSIARRLNTSKADPNNASLVAQGQQAYAIQCARCHGANLEGQPNWKDPLSDGSHPAPPHNASGHTWHHSDELLFNIV